MLPQYFTVCVSVPPLRDNVDVTAIFYCMCFSAPTSRQCRCYRNILLYVFQCPHFATMDGTQNVRVVFRQYASLFFVLGVTPEDNVMSHFAFIHNLVETFNSYFRSLFPCITSGITSCITSIFIP